MEDVEEDINADEIQSDEDSDAEMSWDEDDSDDYADSGCETHSSAASEDEIIEISD
jgi:hypothetical protein